MQLEKIYKGVFSMKNKKIISVLLAFVLLLSFVGCSSTETASTESLKVEKASTETTEPTETTQETKEPEFQEEILVDNENCTFKITDIESDGDWGYTLKVYLENKTDKNLMFSWDDVSVNGFMCDPFWATSVQAGKKANSEISFSETDFEENGIENVENIEFKLSVYDDDNWDAAYLVDETFTLTME